MAELVLCSGMSYHSTMSRDIMINGHRERQQNTRTSIIAIIDSQKTCEAGMGEAARAAAGKAKGKTCMERPICAGVIA